MRDRGPTPSAPAVLMLALAFAVVAMAAINTIRAATTRRADVYRALTCIHHHEGAWDAATGNGFYGGLQMDVSFQRTYGGWIFAHHGTANRWRPATQLLVGYRGWRDRGFQPWPATRKPCGV